MTLERRLRQRRLVRVSPARSASTQWQKVQTEITAPAAYQGITFVLRKAGQRHGGARRDAHPVRRAGAPRAPVTIDAGTLVFGEKCADSGGVRRRASRAPGDPTRHALLAVLAVDALRRRRRACTARSVFLPSQCGPGAGTRAAGRPVPQRQRLRERRLRGRDPGRRSPTRRAPATSTRRSARRRPDELPARTAPAAGSVRVS